MGNVLTKPPVFHTLVQLNINENPKFKEAIDLIHKEFYELGFIEKRLEEIEELEFTTHVKEPRVKKMTSWHFINFEQDAGFVLNPNFIIFHTTNYTNFNNFFEILVSGMNIINKYLDALIIERLGLRYLDAVILGAGENIHTHLSKDFLSVNDRFGLDLKGFKIQHAMSEKILINEEMKENCISRVVSAVLDGNDPLMPQELVPLIRHLKIKEQFKNIKGLMTLIDLDSANIELRLKAKEIDELNQKLSSLHDNISTVFYNIINVEAFS